MRVLMAFLSVVAATASAIGQTAPPTDSSSSDALAILREVTQKYADAKSYHIEATEEFIRSNELGRDWRKRILSIRVAPDHRYRYEGHGAFGSALLVSDGKTSWIYHYDEKLFAEKPVGADIDLGNSIDMQEDALSQAKSLRKVLADAAKELRSASLLPEESVSIDGTPHRCIVIHFSPADMKIDRPQTKEKQESGTYWIDQTQMVIVKMERRSKSFMGPPAPGRITFQNDVTTIFPVVDLNAPIAAASFVFTPPTEAKLTDEFPARTNFEKRQAEIVAAKKANAELLGKVAPDVQLKSADGTVVSLSSYRGKPVLIDVWATWCGPCVAMVPELKKLNSDLSAHGIVLLSVDVEDDPDTADTFLKHENVSWQNLHEVDDTMRSAFHASTAVPWQVFIDSDGKVAFYRRTEDVGELRAAVAALAPQYSSIAAANAEKPH
ncbi:MAG: redoxin domain-containing protein [Candidatus Korobacteraceae bacterium]